MSVALGPAVLSLNRLLLVVAFVVALVVGQLLGRRRRVNVEPALLQMLLGGILIARLSFIAVYFEDYSSSLFGMVDIRDGGFFPAAGLIAALAIGAFHAWRHKAWRTPLLAALASGAAFWMVTAALFGFMRSVQPALPDLALLNVEDQPVLLSEFRGRPAVVNLWASWCPPCRREMPVLARAQQEEEAISFVFVNQGEAASTVRDYLRSSGLELDNVLLDYRSAVSREFGVRGMPTTFFFDASGQLVDSHLGELSAAVLKQKMKRLVE